MPRLLRPAALLALGLAAAAHSASVQPAWTLKNVFFLGFSDRGEVVTQPRSREGWGGPSLERRDPRTGQTLGVVVFPEAGNDLGLLAFTPDLKTAAWLNRTGDVLTVRTPERRWQASTPGLSGTRQPVFSPDGRTLVIPNENGYVQLWDVERGTRRATLLLHSRPDHVAFHPDGQVLAINERSWSADRSSVSLWNLDTGREVSRVPGLRGVLSPFQFAPDGTLLVGRGFFSLGLERLGQGNWGVSVRTLPTYTEPCPRGTGPTTCARGIYGASFNADGSQVLLNFSRTAQNISSALLYDTRTDKLLRTFDTPGAGAILTPDGKGLILNTFQGEVQGAPLP